MQHGHGKYWELSPWEWEGMGLSKLIPSHLYCILNVIYVTFILELNLHFTKQPYYTNVFNAELWFKKYRQMPKAYDVQGTTKDGYKIF